MIPGNCVFPKSPTRFLSVWYDPADVSTMFCGVPVTIERNFAKLARLSYIGRSRSRFEKRDPQKEKRDLIRKSQAALDDPGRREAIQVLFSPQTFDVFVIAKNGALVRAQTSAPDYRRLIGRLEAESRKQETK